MLGSNSKETILKSTPIVDFVSSVKKSSINLSRIEVFPVELSPIRDTLKRYLYDIFDKTSPCLSFFNIFIKFDGLFLGTSIPLFTIS